MAGYRRYYPKKRTYRRRYKKRNYRRPKDTFDYARSAYKAAMQIKRLVNVEVKNFDFSEAAIAASTAWGIRNIAGISQGDTNNTRDGISVKPLNMTVRFHYISPAGAGAGGSLRLILLRGKHEQGDGTTEYVSAYNDGGSGIGDILMFKNETQRYNSTTLYDKTFHMTKGFDYNDQRIIDFSCKLDGHINYAGVSTAPEDGGLYLLFVYEGTTTNVTFDVHSRLTFTDN